MELLSIKISDIDCFYITHNLDQYRYQPQKLFISFSTSVFHPYSIYSPFHDLFLFQYFPFISYFYHLLNIHKVLLAKVSFSKKSYKIEEKLPYHEKLKILHSISLRSRLAASHSQSSTLLLLLSGVIFNLNISPCS